MFPSSVRFEGAKPVSIFHDCEAGLDLVSVLLILLSVTFALDSVSLILAFVSLSFVFLSLGLVFVSLGLVSLSVNLVCISFLEMFLLKTGYRVVMLLSDDAGSEARVATEMRSRIHGVNCNGNLIMRFVYDNQVSLDNYMNVRHNYAIYWHIMSRIWAR